jgi:AraC-like DNA-binding protein
VASRQRSRFTVTSGFVIVFSTRSILLAIGTVHGLVLAALLLCAKTNRLANRMLALLLVVVALRIVPYIIGFAGFFDAYPWLSFLPCDFSLGYGALIWLYTRMICTGAPPAGWRRHLVPAAMQGAYYAVMFLQPLPVKNRWNDTVHEPWIVPMELAWALSAMCAYLLLARRDYVLYQRWLDDDLSNREEFRLTWLRLFLTTFGVTLLLWTGTVLFDVFVRHLNYFDRFPLYLWFSLLVYGLGVGGLRGAGLAYPRALETRDSERRMPASAQGLYAGPIVVAAVPDGLAVASASRPSTTVERQPNWMETGNRWRDLVRAEGWWRDPDLTAPMLARHLATNTTYLSKALNDGLGQNFNEFVNRLRVDAVKAELVRPDLRRDVLAIALDAGFSSKASFNRVFKRLTGQTPTDFRRVSAGPASQNQ